MVDLGTEIGMCAAVRLGILWLPNTVAFTVIQFSGKILFVDSTLVQVCCDLGAE